MIKLVEVLVTFGGRPVIDRQSWMLGDEDRAGLVGENGSGKSTLLKVMAGKLGIDSGTVELSRGLRIGYLPQETKDHKGRTLEEEVKTALGHVIQYKKEYKQIEERLGIEALPSEEQEALVHRMAELMERFERADGYEIDSAVGRVLAGLGFSEDDHKKPVESFSGGWQTRIALAKVLLARPDVLLLDEPTNHLDIDARNWLEEFLTQNRFSYLIVSHDRYFLDVTVQRTVEIERGALIDYRGAYSYYLEEKEKRVARAWTAFHKQQEQIQKDNAFISKYRADRKRAGQVQSRIKRMKKMELVEPPPSTDTVKFQFPPPPRGPQELVRLSGLTKKFNEKTVLDCIDLVLVRGEKAALVGVNGAGKSTLLGIIAGKIEFNGGERTQGAGAEIAYFGQDAGSDLESNDTVLQAIERGAPHEVYPRLRSLLGAFLFSGDDVDKKVSVLSGGEKSRLALAKLLLRSANLLILDEPTNHLDLRAKEVLMDAFRNYTGALVFVAHDRYFMEGLPDRVIEVRDGKVTSYPGDYSYYLRAVSRERREKELSYQEREKRDESIAPASKAERIRQRKEQKRRQRQAKKKRKIFRDLEEEIAETERLIHRLETEMADPDAASDYLRLNELEKNREEFTQKLDTLVKEWERLGNELEATEPTE